MLVKKKKNNNDKYILSVCKLHMQICSLSIKSVPIRCTDTRIPSKKKKETKLIKIQPRLQTGAYPRNYSEYYLC